MSQLVYANVDCCPLLAGLATTVAAEALCCSSNIICFVISGFTIAYTCTIYDVGFGNCHALQAFAEKTHPHCFVGCGMTVINCNWAFKQA